MLSPAYGCCLKTLNEKTPPPPRRRTRHFRRRLSGSSGTLINGGLINAAIKIVAPRRRGDRPFYETNSARAPNRRLGPSVPKSSLGRRIKVVRSALSIPILPNG